jgi:hypothetical protein
VYFLRHRVSYPADDDAYLQSQLSSFEEQPQGKSKREKGDDILFKTFLLESVNESFV